ncbi:MAG: collagen-binding domain-containing protein [Stellaceae bacterium]
MRTFISASVATITILAGAATAGASPIPVATLLGDFNVITDGNFALNGPDVQGPVLVGGNFTSSGAHTLNSNSVIPLPTPLPPGDVLGEVNVFGNTTMAGSVPVSGSLTFVGGMNTNTANTFLATGAGSQLSGHNFSPINFGTDIWGQLTGFSTTLASLPANTPTSMFDPTTGTFTFHENGQGIANVTITGTQLAQHGASALTFNGLPAGGLAIVNVTGGYTDPGSQFAPGAHFSNLLFNFEGANAVSLNIWGASLLALDADVTSTNVITGDVVANEFTAGDETHVNFPDCPASVCNAVVVTPEPGSMALLGSAVAIFAVRRRRRS